MMVMPFMAIYLTSQLGWSKSQAGIVVSSYGLGSLVGAFCGGMIIERIGAYRTMIYGLCMGGLMFMSLMFFKEFYGLVTMIFLTSALADIFRPAAFGALKIYSEPENLTRSNALIRLAINLGIAIGPLIGGVIMANFSFDWLFIIDGLTCICAAIYLRLQLPNIEGKKPKVEKAQRGKSVYQDGKYLLFFAISLINLIVFFQIINVVPLFLKEYYCLTEGQIGLFFTLNGLIIVLVEMPVIHYLESKKLVYLPLMLGILFIGIAHIPLMIFSMPLVLMLVLYNVLVSVGEILNFPFINTYTILKAEGNRQGSYMGLMSMMFSLAYIIAPLIGFNTIERLELHMSMERTYSIFWTGCVVLCLVAFVLFWSLRNRLEVMRE